MAKNEKDLDVGALLLGTDDGPGEDEDGGEEEAGEVDAAAMKREAALALRDALKGDDADALVSAFETMIEACGLSGGYAGEDE